MQSHIERFQKYLHNKLNAFSNTYIKFYILILYNIIHKLGGYMHRRVKSSRSNNEHNNCNAQGDQIIVLGAIISALIYQEIQNDDELNTIGNLFIAVGSNIVLGVSQRVACNNALDKINNPDTSNNENYTTDTSDDGIIPSRSQRSNNSNKIKRVKKTKKVKKKIKKFE